MKTKILVCIMCMVLCVSALGIFNASAAEERTIPSAIVTDFSYMRVLYIKGDSTLWCYDEDTKENKKLLDDVIYIGQGNSSMNFIAIQSDGTLWSCNVNYQEEFTRSLANISDAASTSFQDFANFAVTKDGNLFSWGRTDNTDTWNCMGFAEYDGNYINEEDARLILEDVSSVETCGFNVAALKNDGTLWRWGLGQATPKKIADGIKEIADVTSKAVFGLKENGDLFAWYLYEEDLWGMEESFLKNVKAFDMENNGMAYIETSGRLWLGYATEDFGETHCGEVVNNVKDVALVEAYLKNDEIPAYILTNDNALWLTAKLSENEDYIPFEDDLNKVMDNVESFYVRGNMCTVITKDGNLYLVKVDDDFNKVTNSDMIAQVSDFAPSDWATGEISNAIGLGLLSSDMQRDYKANISRVDFCEILTKTLQAKTGKNIAQLVEESAVAEKKIFNDTDSEYVDYMCRLGIVNGISDKLFDPYAKITREAAAVMLTRAAKVLGFDTTGAVSSEPGVSAWATEGVGFVTQNGIMNGTGNGFEPQGKYTKEQAVATFVRLYNK